MKVMGVEDPTKVVARKQAEDREHVKELSENLQGNDVVESSSLVSSVMKVKKESDAFDARPEAEKGNSTHNSSPINLKSLTNSKIIVECK